VSLGLPGGYLDCAADCHGLDTSRCWSCGNGHIEPLAGEQCDDGNAEVGDGCTPECRSECGNGRVDGGEQCDDGNRMDGDGCSFFCGLEAGYDGGGEDALECNVAWGAMGVVPASVMGCRDGDRRCDVGEAPSECTFLVTYCLRGAPWGGTPGCLPTRIVSLALIEPSLTGSTALSPEAQDAFLHAVRTTLDRNGYMVTRAGPVLELSPALDLVEVCGTARVSVPVAQQRDLVVEVADEERALEHDRITFDCIP